LNRKAWVSGHGRAATLAADIVATATSFAVRSDSYFPAKIGDRVYFGTIASGAVVASTPASATISAISRDSTTAGAASTTQHKVTLSEAVGAAVTAATDTIYFGNQLSSAGVTTYDSSWSQTMHGIPDVVNSGNMGSEEGVVGVAAEYLAGSLNYGGINRSTASNSFWKSQDLSNSGTNRALTTSLMQKAWLTAETVGGVEPGSLEIYTNPGLWATIGLLFVGDRRLSESMTVVGWIYSNQV